VKNPRLTVNLNLNHYQTSSLLNSFHGHSVSNHKIAEFPYSDTIRYYYTVQPQYCATFLLS
jgi:hypothetical protein